jgi:hypothetical protein
LRKLLFFVSLFPFVVLAQDKFDSELFNLVRLQTKKVKAYEALDSLCFQYVKFKSQFDDQYQELNKKFHYCNHLSDLNQDAGLLKLFGAQARDMQELLKKEADKIIKRYPVVKIEKIRELIAIDQEKIKNYVFDFHNRRLLNPELDLDLLFGIDFHQVEVQAMKEVKPERIHEVAGLSKPYLLTPYETIREMADIFKLKDSDVVMDLGSGHGRLLLYYAIIYPKVRFVGVEFSPARARESEAAAKLLQLKNVAIQSIDALKADLSQATLFYYFNSFPSQLSDFMRRLENEHSKKRKFCIVFRRTPLNPILEQHKWLIRKEVFNQGDLVEKYCNY